MKLSLPLAALALLLGAPAALQAQQDTAKCATVTVSRATEADIPALLADAECFAKALQSAANSQALRLAKAKELTQPKPAPSPSPSPSPTPHDDHAMPELPAASWVPSPGIEGAEPLLAEFPWEQGLITRTWGVPGLYDKVNGATGAFRFVCGGDAPLVYDDPLLYPGRPGASHLHQLFGNTGVTAASTAESLGATRSSTCNYGDKTLNRSGYWIPALMLGPDKAVRPDTIAVYYKRATPNSASCRQDSGRTQGVCVDLPNGIRFIFGWDPTRPEEAAKQADWYCSTNGSKHYANLDDLFAAGCPAGSTLVANLIAPECWDGEHLDSPDHRSHMAYGSYGSWGYRRCPATHPYVIPTTEDKAMWTVRPEMIGTRADGTKYSLVTLSSDAMKAGAKPGETLHGDYWERWVTEAKNLWHRECIDKGLDCAAGDLGDGRALIGADRGAKLAEPVVPVPERPV